MERERWQEIALFIVAVAATLYILERVSYLGGQFADIILLFALAWLLAFILSPLIELLTAQPLPAWVGRVGRKKARPHLPHALAVVIVYASLVVLLTIGGIFGMPVIADQLAQLRTSLTEFAPRLPGLIENVEQWLVSLGFDVDLVSVAQPQNLTKQLQAWAGGALQNLLGLVTGVASLLGNSLLVLILGFYMSLDGGALGRRVLRLVPEQYRGQIFVFAESVDKTFGAFLRGQLLQAMLIALGTAAVMLLAGLGFILAGAILAGLLALVPVIGLFLALLPPLAIALFQAPGTLLFVFIVLFVYQQIVANLLMPRLMSEAIGMPPILMLGALLVSVHIAGFWGAFFGIPVAGVIYAMARYLYHHHRGADSAAAEE